MLASDQPESDCAALPLRHMTTQSIVSQSIVSQSIVSQSIILQSIVSQSIISTPLHRLQVCKYSKRSECGSDSQIAPRLSPSASFLLETSSSMNNVAGPLHGC